MADILLLAVISALVGILVPDSKNDGMRKLVSLIAALAILCAICEPIADAAEEADALSAHVQALLFPDAEAENAARADADAWVEARGIANLESGIAALIRSRFSLGDADIQVSVSHSRDAGGAVVVETVHIRITGAECSTSAVETYIGDMLACPCRAECG